ncbi:hypothetical protein B0J13DRAFT_316835 [Dactylonectria estremocensis]|uniref:BZIP domain-containing protein n=1 Tax=Dactylonectria estremocensis TaxID=1079267 RepID=A0A9P9EWP3_9HYPO|nr:hypothetical protein B0J13DRAFT_316835 [Dactylonectria estremocensis]
MLKPPNPLHLLLGNRVPTLLTTSRLEPNHFEQSFGGAPETPGGTKLPSVTASTSPSSLLLGPDLAPFNWGGGSLRTGPLSPGMLSGPTNNYFSDTYHLRSGFPTPVESSLRTGFGRDELRKPPACGVSEGSLASDDSDQARPNTRGKGKKNPPATNGQRKADEAPAKAPPNTKSKASSGAVTIPEDMDMSDEESNMKYDENGTKAKMTDEEKRTNFLERSRAAAMKCRQRKKKWLANLHTKVEMFSTENDALTSQINQLREETVKLKTLLLAHKDCPVTQPQGLHSAFMSQVVEPFNPQMNPCGMGVPMPHQPAIAGQGVQRRFS